MNYAALLDPTFQFNLESVIDYESEDFANLSEIAAAQKTKDFNPDFETVIPHYVQRMKMAEAMAQPYLEQADIAKAQANNLLSTAKWYKTLLQDTVDRLPLDKDDKQKFKAPGLSVWNQVASQPSVKTTELMDQLLDDLHETVHLALSPAMATYIKNHVSAIELAKRLDITPAQLNEYLTFKVEFNYVRQLVIDDYEKETWLQKLFSVAKTVSVRIRQSRSKKS